MTFIELLEMLRQGVVTTRQQIDPLALTQPHRDVLARFEASWASLEPMLCPNVHNLEAIFTVLARILQAMDAAQPPNEGMHEVSDAPGLHSIAAQFETFFDGLTDLIGPSHPLEKIEAALYQLNTGEKPVITAIRRALAEWLAKN